MAHSLGPFELLTHCLVKNGPVHTLRVVRDAMLDMQFDLRHGTDTFGWVDVADLDVSSPNKSRATRYGPTLARPFRRLLQKLSITPKGSFVDLGCGKGRALLLALEYGFENVVGVEFSAELCAVAQANLDRYRHKAANANAIVLTQDVVEYTFQAADRVIYMFDPFDEVVAGRIVENLDKSLQQFPRELWLIYQSPTQHAVLNRAQIFTSFSQEKIGSCSFSIYHHAVI